MDAATMAAYSVAVKPMLAVPQDGRRIETLSGSHTFDVKLDGIRALAFWDGSQLLIRNRSGRDITHRFPELEVSAPEVFGNLPTVVDGEIVAVSGSFQDTAKRDKQNKPEDVARVMHQIPVQYVAFDCLYAAGTDRRGESYLDRRDLLDAVGLSAGFWSASVISTDPSFFEAVRKLGMEGVIAKRNRSSYRPGKNGEWIKFKATHTITAIGVGYEKGEGARSHFGAMFLALIGDDGKPQQIGRVGTGFTNREIDHLKAEFDAGHPVLVEIECLNVTKDGALRFPSYKGIRTDLTWSAASIHQLDSIPRT